MADNFLQKFRRKNSSPEDNLEQVINNVTSAPDIWHKKTQGPPNRHDFRGFNTSETKQRFNQNDDYAEDDNNEEKFGGFVFTNNTKKNNEQKRNVYSNNNNNNNNNYSNNYSNNYQNNQKSNPLKKKPNNPKYNQNPLNKKKPNKFQNNPQQQQYSKDYHPSEEQLSELEQLQQHLLTCGISIGPNDNDINQPSNLQQNSDNEFAEFLNIPDNDSEPNNNKLNYEQQFQQQIYIEAEKKKNDKKKPKKKKQKNKNPQYQQQMHMINNPPEFSTPDSFDPLHFGQKQFPSKSNHFNNNRNHHNNLPPGIMPQQFPQSFGPQNFSELMMSMPMQDMMSMPMQDYPLGPNIQLPPPGMMIPMMGQNPSLGMPIGGPTLPGFLNNQMMPPPSFGFNTQFNIPPVFYPDQFNPMNEGRPHKERNHKKQYQMGNPNFPNLSQAQHPTSLQWDVDDHNDYAINQQQHEQMENFMKVLEQNQFHLEDDEELQEIPIPPPKPKKKLNLNSKPFDPNNVKNN